MEHKREFFCVRRAYTSTVTNFRLRRLLALSCLLSLLSGCAALPQLGTQCESYGVREDHAPMGTRVHIEPLYTDELNIQCAAVEMAVKQHHSDAEVRGCVIPSASGDVLAYYRAGDHCAMNHELCHAIHGSRHTSRYLRDLRNGVPMPYCPENQLAFTSM
jgi:hypothetical protein